jgi:hypothetical protein
MKIAFEHKGNPRVRSTLTGAPKAYGITRYLCVPGMPYVGVTVLCCVCEAGVLVASFSHSAAVFNQNKTCNLNNFNMFFGFIIL